METGSDGLTTVFPRPTQRGELMFGHLPGRRCQRERPSGWGLLPTEKEVEVNSQPGGSKREGGALAALGALRHRGVLAAR